MNPLTPIPMNEYGNLTALFGGIPFDPNAYEPSKGFEVLPPGKYTCLIEGAELKDTKAGTGKYIKVTLSVLGEGDHKNRKLFDNINIFNPSEDCQRMGIAQLSSLGRAAECYPVNDTVDLVGKIVVAVVKVKKREDTGEDANTVRTYENPSAPHGVDPAAWAAAKGGDAVPSAPPTNVIPLAPTQPTAQAPQPISPPTAFTLYL